MTKVLHVRENLLAVGGDGGSILLWDPRHSATPIRTVSLGSGYVSDPHSTLISQRSVLL